MQELNEIRSESLRALFPEYKWNYIADAILEGSMGTVQVNDPDNPQVVALSLAEHKVHILGGDAGHPAAREFVADLPGFTMLFVGQQGWKELLFDVQNGKMITLKRYAFSSETLELARLFELKSRLSEKFTIEKIGANHAQQIADVNKGLAQDHLMGFASFEDYIDRGIGYGVFDNGNLISIASSGAVCSKGIEVQVNTDKKYRGLGLASATCAALLIDCLEKGVDPNWDAASEISAGLARKLGYKPCGEYDYYFYTGSKFLVSLRNFLRRIRGKEI